MSLKITETKDLDHACEIMFHPEIYPFISDDFADQLPRETIIQAMKASSFKLLKVTNGEQDCGVFILDVRGKSAELHTLLLPCCRGAMAVQAGRKMLDYIHTNLGIDQLYGFCFSDCKAAIWFSKKIGFKFDSEVDHPNTRHGEKVKRINFKISPTDFNSLLPCPL
jgi:hypothetical protein